MHLSLRKRTILLTVATVMVISLGSVLYLGAAIDKLQDEATATRADELASIVAKDTDTETLMDFIDMVDEAYDAVTSRVSNDHMGTPEYEDYMSHFYYLEATPEFQALYDDLSALTNVTKVDCFYLCYLDKESKAVVYLVDSGEHNVCHPGSFDYLRGDDIRALADPNMSLVPTVSNTDVYGEVIGSAHPILEGGKVIAYVGVDISMQEIILQRKRLLWNTILSVILLAVVLSAVSLYLSGQLLIKPMDRQQEILDETENLKKENITLARRAQAAQKISALTGSITSLLNNMPALTFSKDMEDGTYLACNQKFAEYAHRRTPADVVGHTDMEIFDIVTATHFVADDRKAMAMDEPYVFREDVPDARGNMRYFQTTKLKFIDSSGRTCLLGMCMDVSELVMIRRENEETRAALDHAVNENLTYSRIARALSSDYTFIYYVNIKDDTYSEYSYEKGEVDAEVAHEGKDFFNLSIKDAQVALYEDDRERFCRSFQKDRILDSIDRDGRYVITYRLLIKNRPVYVNLKAVRLEDDDDHIIIGVNNIDDMMRAKELAERMKEEQITYERIAALSGQYLCIYTVDPETDHYVEYSATTTYDSLGLPKNGDDFFRVTYMEAKRCVHEEDLDRFHKLVSKDNVMDEIEKTGLFSIKYRLILYGEPRFVALNAALVQEKDGPQLIVGVTDVDARERLDQEYARNLEDAEEKANIDSLTGARNKHAYVDLEAQLNEGIEKGQAENFAVVVCDVNGLKKVNDTLGHKAGDDLIRKACGIIGVTFGKDDLFRIGGDEFAVILRGDALDMADRKMAEMRKNNLRSTKNGGVVIACGMSRYEKDDKDVSRVFERADAAMYKNKEELKKGTQEPS